MSLFGGVWYAGVDTPTPQPGLKLEPAELAAMVASAPGTPVTWEHSAYEAINAAPAGGERAAALASDRVIGTVLASWVDRSGAARVVFRVAGVCVNGLLRTRLLQHLSATHVVGEPRMLELSLTRAPARPRCVIDGIGIASVAAYIAAHPPGVTAAQQP